MLGIDPDTLRRWSDAGRVRSYTTPGGHRRFSHADLTRLQQRSRAPGASLETLGATTDRLARAYARTYRSGVAADAARAVTGTDREAYRTAGRELVETLLAYLDAKAPSERAALESRASDSVTRTALRLAGTGVPLTQAIEAFVTARRPLLQALEALGRREALPAARMTALYADAAAILDRLLLRFVAAFELPGEG
jgi:DNA-binding transcriptional MerR regulator